MAGRTARHGRILSHLSGSCYPMPTSCLCLCRCLRLRSYPATRPVLPCSLRRLPRSTSAALDYERFIVCPHAPARVLLPVTPLSDTSTHCVLLLWLSYVFQPILPIHTKPQNRTTGALVAFLDWMMQTSSGGLALSESHPTRYQYICSNSRMLALAAFIEQMPLFCNAGIPFL